MGVTHVKGPLPGPKGKKLLEQWHRYEADVVGFQAPVIWESARGCVVRDVDGNTYIDWTSGVLVTNVGHCHPRLVERHLNRCFFLSTGSEAIEGALRLMKRRTGRFEIISFEGGFHGRTFGAASVGGMPGPKRMYGPTMPGVIRLPFPNPYRDPCGWCRGAPTYKKYFDYVESVIAANSTGSLAGVIVEPYQGAAGFIFPPRGWLKRLEQWAHANGLLFALDEVQSSYGRTGKMWAMEHEGLKPDIVTIGKAIGCGVPVSAIAATADVFSCLKKGEMSSTLGGNPVSSAVVPVILDIMKRERLVENSARMGAYMKRRLKAMAKSCPYLGDVRGMGLVMGLEFVKDKRTKEPAPELIRPLILACANRGLLVGSVGMHGNVIRVAPPLVITRDEADESLAIMQKCLEELKL